MQLLAGGDGPRPRRRWWEVAAPSLLVCGAWVIVAATHLFGVWIANLGLFSWLVYVLAWLVGIALTAMGVVALWMLRGPAWAVPTLAVSVLTATVIVAVDWTYSFVHGYYRLNRGPRPGRRRQPREHRHQLKLELPGAGSVGEVVGAVVPAALPDHGHDQAVGAG